MRHMAIIEKPKQSVVIWDDDTGLLAMDPLHIVKRDMPNLWRELPRLTRFTFEDGHDSSAPASISGKDLHLNSVGLLQLMFHHMGKVSKDWSFVPQDHLRKYFDRLDNSHNNARNWFDHVFPTLIGKGNTMGSVSRYSVGRERQKRGPLWRGLTVLAASDRNNP